MLISDLPDTLSDIVINTVFNLYKNEFVTWFCKYDKQYYQNTYDGLESILEDNFTNSEILDDVSNNIQDKDDLLYVDGNSVCSILLDMEDSAEFIILNMPVGEFLFSMEPVKPECYNLLNKIDTVYKLEAELQSNTTKEVFPEAFKFIQDTKNQIEKQIENLK